MDTAAVNVLILIISCTLIIVLLIVVSMLLFQAYQKRKIEYAQKISQLKLQYEKRQLELQLEIQEATFQNISREIHDNISLSLTLAKLYLNTLEFNESETPDPKIEASVELITTAI